MNSQDAVTRAISAVKAAVPQVPVYPHTVKKDITDPEYICVNTLGFPDSVLAQGFVNININVKDKQCLIDNKRLFEIGEYIKAKIITSNDDQSDFISFELRNEQVFQEDGFHSLNLKYHVVMLNK
jgi:hypothetical protein